MALDVVTLQAAKAMVRVENRTQTWKQLATGPGTNGVPQIMAVPLDVTETAVAATGQTAPASSIDDAVHVYPSDAGAFTLHGARMVEGPLVGGSVASVVAYGASTGPQQSPSPYTVSTQLDTVDGSFDVVTRDLAATEVRITVDGEYITRAGQAAPGTGGGAVIINVDGLSAGRHQIDVEFGGLTTFCGFNIGPLDGLTKNAPLSPLRVMVVGDSFTEPSVNDEAATYFKWGFPQIMGRMLGCEVMSSGSGGTGYTDPGDNDRTTVPLRVDTDVIPDAPDVVIWSAGLNDWGAEADPADVTTAVRSCITQVAEALPLTLQVVTSPLIATGYLTYPTSLFEIRDAIQAAAVAEDVTYVDLMEITPEYLTQTGGELTSAVSVSASTFACDVSIRQGTLVRVGPAATAEIRMIIGVSGTGPYTHTVANAFQLGHASGAPVAISGPGWCPTGSGDQANPTGLGVADRYCGPDGTHPTSDNPESGGHPAIAAALHQSLTRAALANT